MTAPLTILQLGLLRWFMEQESIARVIARCLPSTIAFQERKSIGFSIFYVTSNLCFYDINFGDSVFFFIFETEINHIVFYPLKNSKALLLFSFILSSNKYLLSDYYLPSILQSTGDGPVSKVYGDKYYERQWSRKWVGEREVIWHRSLTVKEYLYRDLKEGRESAM